MAWPLAEALPALRLDLVIELADPPDGTCFEREIRAAPTIRGDSHRPGPPAHGRLGATRISAGRDGYDGGFSTAMGYYRQICGATVMAATWRTVDAIKSD
jgi:hypothetical protein